jgi:hypothetical protein
MRPDSNQLWAADRCNGTTAWKQPAHWRDWEHLATQWYQEWREERWMPPMTFWFWAVLPQCFFNTFQFSIWYIYTYTYIFTYISIHISIYTCIEQYSYIEYLYACMHHLYMHIQYMYISIPFPTSVQSIQALHVHTSIYSHISYSNLAPTLSISLYLFVSLSISIYLYLPFTSLSLSFYPSSFSLSL